MPHEGAAHPAPAPAAQVPVVISLSGGVAPAALGAPAVGVLLRLSLACYLQLPLAAVLLVGAASTDPAVPTLALGPGDPANTQTGFCAQVTAAAAPAGSAAPSTAPAAGGPTTTVSLVVLSCVGPSGTGVPGPLQALLNSLGSWPAPAPSANSTASPVAAGASPAPSPPPASLFSAFLLSAAPAGSGGGASASSPIVGPPVPHPSPSPPTATATQQQAGGAQPGAGASSSGSSAGTGASSSVAIIGGAAGGGALVLALLVVLGFWLVLREQRRRAGKPMQTSNAASDAADEGGDADVSFVNRMHIVSVPAGGDAATAPTEKGLAAVAAFKVCVGVWGAWWYLLYCTVTGGCTLSPSCSRPL